MIANMKARMKGEELFKGVSVNIGQIKTPTRGKIVRRRAFLILLEF